MVFDLIEAVKSFLRMHPLKARVCDQKTRRCNLLEVIAQAQGGSVVSCREIGCGVTRIKIVVTKQNLNKILKMMEIDKKSSSQGPQSLSSTLQQWRPALKSIAEEQ